MSALLKQAYEARAKKINKIEKTKALKTPKEAFELLEYYAAEGYDAISDEDKSYFLKCFGIYDRPATPRQFMIRLRIPGGQLNNEQAVAIGEVACDHGNDYIDITTRMQIELRYLNIEAIPTLLKKLESVGITAYQTGVDNFRNIMNDPLDGVGMDTILPSQPLLEKLQSRFLHNWEWISALPRKFNTSITGSMTNRSNAFGHDCSLVLAQREGLYGYNLYLGGKVGQVAKSADIFFKNEAEVEAGYQALIELFRDYGFRDNRNKNRLYFLIEAVGMDAVTTAIRERASIDFAKAGVTLTQMECTDPDQGRVQLRDGSFALHAVIPSGIFSGSALLLAADASKTFGDGRIRLDVEQSLYLIGIKQEQIASALEHPFFEAYKNVDSPYFNHMIACAGTEHCPFGVIPNKPDAIDMAEYLTQAVPLEEGRIRMYWSACVKGCGIHGVGDIGFEGCKAKVNGQSEYGVHILVGGKLTGEGEEGHSVMKSVPLRFAHHYVESLVREYRRLKQPGESFARFHDRILANYSHAAIGFVMRLQAYLRTQKINIPYGFQAKVTTGRNEAFELFDMGTHLYYQLSGERAYESTARFAPDTSKKPAPLKESDPTLADIVYRMIHPDEKQRASVFSELQERIAITG
ncbi:MAG: ferredoxin--nitrite reductase [Campylobacterota bacterium]|nr:ferredoxin--nitrite reductase [Campylobacterota bacterium]